MTEQQRFAYHAIGTIITGVEWLAKWDDGEEVDEDHPQLTALQLSNGDAITFDGAGEAYYQHRHIYNNRPSGSVPPEHNSKELTMEPPSGNLSPQNVQDLPPRES